MENFRSTYRIAGPFLLLGLAAVMTLPQVVSGQGNPGPAAPRGPKNVLVVNTKAQPVPVTGSVGINGTPTVGAQQNGAWNVGINGTPMVNAQQSGAWNVGINGTPTVQVNSSVASPLLIRNVNDGDEIFQTVVFVLIPDGAHSAAVSIPIPPARRVVLESVSARARVPMGQKAEAILSISSVAGGANIFLPLVDQGVFPGNEASFAGAQLVRAYADQNVLTAAFGRTVDMGVARGLMSISGYVTGAL